MAKDLFVEVFPIQVDTLPQLSAYRVVFDLTKGDAYGGKLAYRLNRTFPGGWVWFNDVIITDSPVSPVQMDIAIDVLRSEIPDLYAHLESVEEAPRWQLTPLAAAEYVDKMLIRQAATEMRDILNQLGTRITNGYVMRDHQLQTWVVDNMPAVSLSVHSHLLYDHNAQHYIEQAGTDVIRGLRVMDSTASTMVATVKSISGQLRDHRTKLLDMTRREVMQEALRAAADDEYVLAVDTGRYTYEYLARMLRVLVDDAYERFEINPDQARTALQLSPSTRAQFVRTVSDVLKNKGIIDNAYNSRTHKHLFATMSFIPNLVYDQQRAREYRPEALATDFVQNGLFARHPRFANAPVRLAVINTLDSIADDFVEALRRQVDKDFGYKLEIVKERQVRVVNDKNIASAVRAVEQENPQIVLAFFPDNEGAANADFLKSLTLGKGIAAQTLFERTLHDTDAMALVIMGLLAKTGNTPFALAEPLEYADYVVGFDVVRERTSSGDRIVAMARIYQNNGVFVRYYMDTIELDSGDNVPFVVLQKLFPEALLSDKRVIIHHDGRFADDLLHQLSRWAEVLGAVFYPVEIVRDNVPRLYGLAEGITQPDWGSMFILSEHEGFAMAALPKDDNASRPLHIKTLNSELPIGQAVYSVLAWTLLNYGDLGNPNVPVTILRAEEMAHWLARGMLPQNTEDDVPFWL